MTMGLGLLRLGIGVDVGGGVSAPFDPTTVPWLTLDLNADVGITQAAGVVSAWANQGSAGLSFTATGTGKPAYNATAIHGRPGLAFDGVDDYMTAAALALDALIVGSTYCMFVLANFVSSTATFGDAGCSVIHDTGSYFGGCQMADDGTGYLYHASGGVKLASGTLVPATDSVWTGLYDGTDMRFRVDAPATGTPKTTAGLPSVMGNSLVVGSNYDHTARAVFAVRRVMVYSPAPSASDIVKIQAYLAAF